MGRGLSELQRWILWRAAQRPDYDGMLAMWRVISEFYCIKLDFEPDHDSIVFRGKDVTSERVAVTRAFDRLARRGLVERHSTLIGRRPAITLTEHGERVARNLVPFESVTVMKVP